MKKVPRLSQTQRWFTEYYSVDSVTATDMRNLNKVKESISFEISNIWIGRQSFYRPFQGVESYEPGCAGCDQRTFSHSSIVSRHDSGWRCPVTESPLEISPGDYFDTDSPSRRICFRIDSPPGDYILK